MAVVRVRGEILALPKGHPIGDESAAEAARREVREETGLEAEVVEQLGDVKYWYVRGGKRGAMKVVTFFLFRYRRATSRITTTRSRRRSGSRSRRRPERLAYKGEREMAVAALSRAEEGR